MSTIAATHAGRVRRPSLRAAVLLALALPGTAGAAADSLFHDVRPAMGTRFEIFLYAPDAVRAAELFELAAEEVERVEAALSSYRPASELNRLNAGASDGPVTTDPETFGLIERSLAFSRLTGGAFDVTVGRLVRAWGFFRGAGRYPDDAALGAARAQTGWRHVRLDPQARTVRYLAPGLEIDLGGIGKGYALDRVAGLLRGAGVRAALIGLGASSYYAIGAPPGRDGWTIRVPQPTDRERTLSVVRLRDESLSTSGSYEKFFRLDGRVYCHLFDPRTGAPVEGMLQTTVVTARAEDSDALSTAFFVLGPSAAAELLGRRPDASVLLVSGEGSAPAVHALNWRGEPGVAAAAKQIP